jgi:hypothetical protein
MNTHPQRYEVERHEDWRFWTMKNVPFLKLDPDWEIAVIAPFGGAMARFVIRNGSHTISVYMDTMAALGAWETPHWEIYPDSSGENSRFSLSESEAMLEAIRLSFEAMKNHGSDQSSDH